MSAKRASAQAFRYSNRCYHRFLPTIVCGITISRVLEWSAHPAQRHMHERIPDQSISGPALQKAEVITLATRLWASLDRMHHEANARVRTDPHGRISRERAELLNATLDIAKRMLEQHGVAYELTLLNPNNPETNTEVLLLLGKYRGSLRAFRYQVLHEMPFSF
jgi:hypothetical protein